MHLESFETIIGYEFKNKDLLLESLTHPSITHETRARASAHNQRLEFLGDAVLQLVLTERLYRLYPDLPEGKLTQLRAHLANRHTLWRRARAVEMGRFIRLGKGEETSGGRERLSNLADAYEALLGAIYLDKGVRAARAFILRQFVEEFAGLEVHPHNQNPKGRLQELLQAQSPANPNYRVVLETGPDHNKHFEVIVEWQGEEIGRGNGSSKKTAETNAAEAALRHVTSTMSDKSHGSGRHKQPATPKSASAPAGDDDNNHTT
jgi:ribonuclease-3